MVDKRNKKKSILQLLIMMISLWLIYILILIIGHMIPVSSIQNNLSISCEQISKEGLYPSFVYGSWDNYTDALFISSIATEYKGNLLGQVVANAYTTTSDNDSELPDHFFALCNGLSGSTEISTYSRYWAGNYTLYKLLLLIMPLNQIRIFLLCVTICLLLMVCIYIYRIFGLKLIPFFLLIFEFKIGIKSSMCLTYNSDIILMLINVIVCCILYKKKLFSYYMPLFFLIGSLSAFLGYWAFPLITLAVPLIILVGIYQKNSEYQGLVSLIFKYSIMWCAGLGSTVIAKIILSICVLGDNSGISQMFFRLGENVGISDRLASVFRFVENEFFFQADYLIGMTALLVIGLAYMVRTTQRFWMKLLPYLILAAYPFIWTIITVGHISHDFDHFNFYIFYSAIALFICTNINLKKFTLFLNKKDMMTFLFYCVILVLLFAFTIKYKPKQITPYTVDALTETKIGDGIIQEFELQDKRVKNLDLIQTIFICNNKDIVSVMLTDGDQIKKVVDVSIDPALNGEWTIIPMDILVKPNHIYQIKYTTDKKNEDLFLLTQAESEANPFNKNCFIETEKEIAGRIANIYEYRAAIDIYTKIYVSVIFLFVIQIILSLTCKPYDVL